MADLQNVQGLRELQMEIDKLNKSLSDAMPSVVMDAAEIIEEEIRKRAPKRTGKLIAALDAKSEQRKSEASATVQIERSDPDGVEHYAIFQEFGTSKMPAKPFFRPGIEASKSKAESAIVYGVAKEIKQAGGE